LSEFGGKEEFSVLAEGYQAITDELKKEFLELGGYIQLKITVLDVLEGAEGITIKATSGQLHAKHCILALPSEALKKLPSIAPKMPILKHLTMSPLVRMYAIFPVKQGHCWFSDLNSTVVASPLRYIIPVNSAKGIIMISYTDGEDALHWMRIHKEKGLAEVKRQVMSLIRHTFPHRTIPNPLEFKIYPWSNGCTYWAPGLYDPEALLKKAYIVSDRIYACGESLALRQCWVESAFESATAMLKEIA
jgi:monoamine oxidase